MEVPQKQSMPPIPTDTYGVGFIEIGRPMPTMPIMSKQGREEAEKRLKVESAAALGAMLYEAGIIKVDIGTRVVPSVALIVAPTISAKMGFVRVERVEGVIRDAQISALIALANKLAEEANNDRPPLDVIKDLIKEINVKSVVYTAQEQR